MSVRSSFVPPKLAHRVLLPAGCAAHDRPQPLRRARHGSRPTPGTRRSWTKLRGAPASPGGSVCIGTRLWSTAEPGLRYARFGTARRVLALASSAAPWRQRERRSRGCEVSPFDERATFGRMSSRARSPLPSRDCESGGRERERGSAGQSAHAVPMQDAGRGGRVEHRGAGADTGARSATAAHASLTWAASAGPVPRARRPRAGDRPPRRACRAARRRSRACARRARARGRRRGPESVGRETARSRS